MFKLQNFLHDFTARNAMRLDSMLMILSERFTPDTKDSLICYRSRVFPILIVLPELT